MLFLSALGVVLTTHLVFFYESGTVVDPVCTGERACASVIAQDPTFLGLPSAVMGLLFYLTIAALSVGVMLNLGGARGTMKTIRKIAIVCGLAYSTFLTIVQLFGLDGFCMLCLGSFLIVTAMFLTPFIVPAKPYSVGGRDRVFAIMVGVVVGLLLLADLSWYRGKLQESEDLRLAQQSASVNLNDCRYDDSIPRFENLNSLIGEGDPSSGPVGAPVTIFEFLDPNCPACKAMHPTMQQIVAQYPAEVRVIYKLATIVGGTQFSLDEVMALWLANEQGMFEEMIEEMFDRQNPEGLSVDNLVDIAGDLGMDERVFRTELSSRRLESRARQIMRAFDGMQLSSVPTILINGQKVLSSRSMTNPGCLSYLIEQELAK